MSRIIRAKVISDSSADEYARVKLSFPSVWKESPLIESVGMIPLAKGDYVFVDVSDGFDNPLILGRSASSQFKPAHSGNGSILFQSMSGSDYSIAFVKNSKIEIYNSKGLSIVLDGANIEIKSGGTLTMGGTAKQSGTGAFCAMQVCPFTGAVHVGNKVEGI